MSGYVHCPSQVGRDRRVRAAVKRLFDRRQVDAAELSPSVEVALRLLSMHVLDLDLKGEGFEDRVRATQALAEARGELEIAQRLKELAELLQEGPPNTVSDAAEDHLRTTINEATFKTHR